MPVKSLGSRTSNVIVDYQILYSFQGNLSIDGGEPRAPLFLASDGYFYGTTRRELETVFKIASDGSNYSLLHNFQEVEDNGQYPLSPVIEGQDGFLYGTTALSENLGYPEWAGIVYRVSKDNSQYQILHRFNDGSWPNDGLHPYSQGLIFGGDGFLYGTTSTGGTGIDGEYPGGKGTIYRLRNDGTDYEVVHNFGDGTTSDDGIAPEAGLLHLADGYFYGTTSSGGPKDEINNVTYGTLFKLHGDGSNYTIIHDFHDGSVANDGSGPSSALIRGSDGYMYGVTGGGGTGYGINGNVGAGTAYRLAADGSNYEIVHNFGDNSVSSDGLYPAGALVQATDGFLYGTTPLGGKAGWSAYAGTAFRMALDGTGYTILHNFLDGTVLGDGSNPNGGLVQGLDGYMYGTTPYGGDYGTVYKLTVIDNPLSIRWPSPLASPAVLISDPHDNVDAPLQLIADETKLKGQRIVSQGLVADGVTPLIIQFDPNPAPTTPTIYSIATSIKGGTVATKNDLNLYQYVLQTGTTPQFVLGNTIIVSTVHPTGFAYISGIKSEDVSFAPGSQELTVTSQITKSGDINPTATLSFKIRKPPIVLVHGIFSDNDTWYTSGGAPGDFLITLELFRPSDFILPVEYGVNRTERDIDTTSATFDSFEALAPKLDKQLRNIVESQEGLLRQAWAFTRYDAIGHSQGGLLLRMLCTYADPDGSDFYPFRSLDNGYRGRFRRVVTLNSPHNGTLLYTYLFKLLHVNPELFPDLTKWCLDKFNPFGEDSQIHEINWGKWPVDHNAKLNLVATAINDGSSPLLRQPSPKEYLKSGLTLQLPNQAGTVGQLVIPRGSDGIVDFLSEFAGIDSNGANGRTYVSTRNISHFEDPDLFAKSTSDPVDFATNSADEAYTVIALLDDAASAASFSVAAVDPALESQIQDAAPPTRNVLGVIFSRGSDRGMKSTQTTYNFVLRPPRDAKPAGRPTWYADVTGPNGVSTDGISVAPNGATGSQVSVTVDDTVLGDVVLHVSYNDSSGES